MKKYQHTDDQGIVILANASNVRLQVDDHIHNVLTTMSFRECNDGEATGKIECSKIKLIIWHGETLPLEVRNAGCQVVLLKMSSEGFSKEPDFLNIPAGIHKPRYYLQGGAERERKPTNAEQWKRLIEWLLSIRKNEWSEGEKPPLPEDSEIRKFIYPESYPDTLIAWYLAEVAKNRSIHINLPEELINVAEQEYKQLSIMHGHSIAFDREGAKRLFQKMVGKDIMLTPWNIPCEANTLRGQLKHSWLENQLCMMKTENILSYWQKGKIWPALETEFDVRIEETIMLADNLADGFSPAQLVDQLRPLAHFTERERALIRKAVHEAYLESSGIVNLQSPFKKSATSLSKDIAQLRDAWKKSTSSENRQQVEEAWERVSIKAKELLELIKSLPTGVVLP